MNLKLTLSLTIIFIVLFYSFKSYSMTLPVQAYDEKLWVTNSWNLTFDNDQPMLLKYVFKSWLSIKHNPDSKPEIDEMVINARTVSQILLSLNIVLAVLFFLKHKGLLFSLLVLFIYSSNYLLIRNGVLAQSESLFVILFNLSLFFMFEYFSNKFRAKDLILFSVFTGLTFATKLNGIMPYLFFLILYNIEVIKDRVKVNFSFVSRLFIPLITVFSIFVILNPFVRNSPILNTLDMFQHRREIVSTQTKLFYESAIPNIGNRYIAVIDNLFLKVKLPLLTTTLFLIGFSKAIKESLKNNKFSNIIMKIFLVAFIITGFYFELNWPRYLTHLVLFVVYFQVEGILEILKRLFGRSQKFNTYINLGGTVS